jgi:hypothetical protein
VSELQEALQVELDKRTVQVCSADPTWQRIRGMLDVAEGKVTINDTDPEGDKTEKEES